MMKSVLISTESGNDPLSMLASSPPPAPAPAQPQPPTILPLLPSPTARDPTAAVRPRTSAGGAQEAAARAGGSGQSPRPASSSSGPNEKLRQDITSLSDLEEARMQRKKDKQNEDQFGQPQRVARTVALVDDQYAGSSSPSHNANDPSGINSPSVSVTASGSKVIRRKVRHHNDAPSSDPSSSPTDGAQSPPSPRSTSSNNAAGDATDQSESKNNGGSPSDPASSSTPSASSVAASAPATPSSQSKTQPAASNSQVPPPGPPTKEQIAKCLQDDWIRRGLHLGERLVMKIEDVTYLSELQTQTQGTLIMTSYQLFFQTYKHSRLDPGASLDHVAVPLGTIERLETQRLKVGLPVVLSAQGQSSSSAGPSGPGAPPSVSPAAGVLPNTTAAAAAAAGAGGNIITQLLLCYCKDMRILRFGFVDPNVQKQATNCLEQYVFPARVEYLFAFSHKLTVPLSDDINGWKLYDVVKEYKRLGLPNDDFRLSDINKDFQLCSSYPQLICVPSERYLSDRELLEVSSFRSRGRIPILSWKHPYRQQTLWRCSQPRVGMNATRSSEDEKLLDLIHTLNTENSKSTIIFDSRPKINAYGNKLSGKGFEDVNCYKKCSIRFMDIQNIHVMRVSCQKLQSLAIKFNPADPAFHTQLEATGWLSHLSAILRATLAMVKAIDKEKASIVSHCSDGWDRTSQLVALTELCLDPYYRTTRGFIVLIEKEWLSVGHKFQERTGHKDKNFQDDQRAPIFLQFLDSVWQLMHQFPTAFEFNSLFLVTLADHLFSCRFGTFFFDTVQERLKADLASKTVSVWSYLLGSPAALAGHFTNPFYRPPCPDYDGRFPTPQQIASTPHGINQPTFSGVVLYPTFSTKKIVLWSDYWLRWNVEAVHGCNPIPGRGLPSLSVTTSVHEAEMRREQKEHRAALMRMRSLEAKSAKLEQQLLQLQAHLKAVLPSDPAIAALTNSEEKPADAAASTEQPPAPAPLARDASSNGIPTDLKAPEDLGVELAAVRAVPVSSSSDLIPTSGPEHAPTTPTASASAPSAAAAGGKESGVQSAANDDASSSTSVESGAAVAVPAGGPPPIAVGAAPSNEDDWELDMTTSPTGVNMNMAASIMPIDEKEYAEREKELEALLSGAVVDQLEDDPTVDTSKMDESTLDLDVESNRAAARSAMSPPPPDDD